MKTFLTRTISGAIYAAVILGSIYSGPLVFGLLMFVVLILSISEFYRIMQAIGHPPSKLLLITASAFIYLTGFIITLKALPPNFTGFIILVFFLSILVQLFQKTEKAIERTGMLLLGLSYLALPVLSFNFLYYRSFSFDDPGFTILTGLFILTWINDTFAYITGSLTGRHKLAERISPNKTWEGSIGGFIFTLAGAFVFYKVFHEIELVEWMLLAVIIVFSGTLGDLFESVLKRNAGIKESGNLIPGHGGILDRIDSVLISSPVVFIYVFFILN